MTEQRFQELVEQALKELPAFFKEKLDNVEVTIDEWPNINLAPGQLLFGLYQGVPKTKRGRGYNMVLPDKITIFRGPIEIASRENEETIKNLVVDTVQHEIAHHFGIPDSRLRDLKKA